MKAVSTRIEGTSGDFSTAKLACSTCALCSVGYFFGNLPVVKNNLTTVILLIVAISISPGLVAWAKVRLQGRRA